MRFLIHGARRSTGEELTLRISAPNKESAERIARESGMVVSDIVPCVDAQDLLAFDATPQPPLGTQDKASRTLQNIEHLLSTLNLHTSDRLQRIDDCLSQRLQKTEHSLLYIQSTLATKTISAFPGQHISKNASVVIFHGNLVCYCAYVILGLAFLSLIMGCYCIANAPYDVATWWLKFFLGLLLSGIGVLGFGSMIRLAAHTSEAILHIARRV